MNPPEGLREAGTAAWEQAVQAIAEQTVPAERFRAAAERFAREIDRAEHFTSEWAELGEPALTKGGATGKADVPHPLIALIATAEERAARFGAALGLDPQSRKKLGATRGRPQERVPDRKSDEPPKVVPLRAVS